ncbi:hypothetical protein ACFFMM_14775 [Micromonospora chaiyaphumensis]|uniref:Uncharacterized protein n=1 Tax=Micromonospora chaiyaphumensis TaxID=307119 RepID=A0A1C4YGJ6_9ACTN|nr:hypothetical protein [Micromonospora chaiyaphumensis]SCF19852.1 hypothetical protein GA0070214_108192 [Micromonospora chaiyaphumensis]
MLAEDEVSTDTAIAAVTAAGGAMASHTDDVGRIQVTSTRADFASRATAAGVLLGVAEQKAIGRKPKSDRVEQEHLLRTRWLVPRRLRHRHVPHRRQRGTRPGVRP